MNRRRWVWAAVVAPILLVMALHVVLLTPPGRALLRWGAEVGVAAALDGTLSIGAVEGSPYGTLALSNVWLRTKSGDTVAAADRIEVTHRFTALLGGNVHVRRVEVTGLIFDLPALQSILPASDDAPDDDDDDGEMILIVVDEGFIDAPRVVLDEDNELADLRLSATATVGPDGIAGTVHEFTGRRSGLPLALKGMFELDEGRLSALVATASVGDVHVELERPSGATEAVAVEGQLRWPAGALAALIGAPVMRAGADLRLHLVGSMDALQARLTGRLGAGRIRLEARGPADPIEATLVAEDFDPSLVHDAAPPAKLDLNLTANARVRGLRPRGRADLDLRGTIRPLPSSKVIGIRDASVRASLADGEAAADVRLDTSAGDVRAEARLRELAADGRLDTQLYVEALRLGEWVDGVDGTVTATLTAEGPAAAPEVQGDLHAERVRAGDLKIGDVALAGLSVRPTRGRVAIRWQRLQWTTPAAVWRSTAGLVRVGDDRLSVFNLALASDRGALEAGGDLDLEHPFGATSTATVRLDAIDLAAFRGLDPDRLGRLRGRVDGTVAFDGPGERLSAELELRRARLSSAWPQSNARVSASVDPTDARLDADASGSRWGRATVSFRMDSPSDWRRPEAWTAGGLEPVRAVSAEFDVALDRALPDLFEGGKTKGTVSIASGGRALNVRVSAQDVAAPGYPLLSDLEVRARSKDRSTVARATAAVEGRPALAVTSTIQATVADLLDVSLTGVPVEARAETDGFPIELLGLRVAGGSPSGPPVRGQLSMRAVGRNDPDGPRLRADVRVKEVRVAPDAPPVEGTVVARLSDRAASASVALSAPELGQHRLTARSRVPARFDAVSWAKSIDELRYDSGDVSIAAVGALAGARGLSGRLGVRVSAERGLKALTATVVANRVGLSPALSPADLDLRLVQTATQTTIRSVALLGGDELVELAMSAPRTVLDGLERGFGDWPIEGRVESPAFRLERALSAAAGRRKIRGQLELRADLAGTPAAPRIGARANLDGLQLGETRFETFEVEHQQDPQTRLTEATLVQASGGRLEARVDAFDPKSLSVDLTSEAFRLAFLATLADLTETGAVIDGKLDGSAKVRGPADDPQLEGQLTAKELRVALPGAPPVEQGVLDVNLDGQTAKVDLRAQSGAGSIRANLTGSAERDADPALSGTIALDGVQATAGGQVVSVDLDGRVTGRREPSSFDAEVVLTDGFVRLPDRTSRDLHPITNRSDVVYQNSRWAGVVQTRTPSPSDSAVAVRVRTARPIGVRGEPIEAVVNLDVTARPVRRGVSVRGDARIEQGTVTLFGRRYTVDRAQVVMGGQVPVQPRLDVLLSYEFTACSFFIGLSGPASDPKLNLSAEPDIYSDKQLLGFLFGASPDEDNPDKTPQQQGVDAAAGLLLGQLQSQLKRNLPIDTLAVDLGDGAASGQANVSLGKWLTDKLFVAYTYRHGAAQSENTSEGLLRYRFFRSWLVELVFGDRGNGAADLLWTKRW